jgi:hypothetical protein
MQTGEIVKAKGGIKVISSGTWFLRRKNAGRGEPEETTTCDYGNSFSLHYNGSRTNLTYFSYIVFYPSVPEMDTSEAQRYLYSNSQESYYIDTRPDGRNNNP